VTPKPQTHNGDLRHLPPALASLCQQKCWVVWKWEWRKTKDGGKWTKPPRQARNYKLAEVNDPSTWASYEEAVEAYSRYGAGPRVMNGIGFVLTGADIGALDLDHCVDPVTGAMAPWAAELDGDCNGCYREITVSGTGLRIIGTASGGEVHRRFKIDDNGAGLEIYRHTARYITISGREFEQQCSELPSIDGLIDTLLTRYEGSNGHTGKFDFNAAGTQSKSIDYEDIIRNGAPNGDRSELFQSCVNHLAAKGMTLEEIIEELARYPNGIGSKYAGRLQQETERSYRKRESTRRPKAAPIQPDEPLQWDKLDKKGKPLPTPRNLRTAIRALEIQCRYDIFHDKLLVESPNLQHHDNFDHAVLELRLLIRMAYEFEPSTNALHEAVTIRCLKNRFDPVVDYLDALVWDGSPRLERWLITYTGADDTELNRELGPISLIAAVKRARYPGCKFDQIIVLEGPMGTQKSKAIEILAGIENFSDQSIFGARDREQQELLAGVWLYEIAELSNIRKTEVEHIKAFASRRYDRARPAYGHTRIDQPRRCVLFATTNNDRYLKEADRRFWPIKTNAIDIEALRRDRDQLWAEAAQQEREGASIVLRQDLWAAARIEQEAREDDDPWDDKLVDVIGSIEQGEERVQSTDLLETVLGHPISRQRDVDFKRLGRCMRRLGWDGPKKTLIGNRQVKGYTRPKQ
jgi:hypothetical protein